MIMWQYPRCPHCRALHPALHQPCTVRSIVQLDYEQPMQPEAPYYIEEQSELSLELTPEMIDFLRRSAERKRQRRQEEREQQQRRREEAKQQALENWKPYQQKEDEHMQELVQIYGENGAYDIRLLETGINANYDTQRDMRRPVLWPSMPLRI